MKNHLKILLLAACLSARAFAQQTAALPDDSSATALRELANGYAAAFTVMRNETSHEITLLVQHGEKSLVLRDVRAVTAAGAVLMVSVGSMEQKYAINPRDVVVVTVGRDLRVDGQAITVN